MRVSLAGRGAHSTHLRHISACPVRSVTQSTTQHRHTVVAAARQDPATFRYSRAGPFATSTFASEDWCRFSPDNKHTVKIRVTGPSSVHENVTSRFPVVIFFNGFLLQDKYYLGIVEHLASWGYVVVQYTNQGKVPGLPSLVIVPDAEEVGFMGPVLEHVRPHIYGLFRDVDFDKIITVGHSRGGKLAALHFATDNPYGRRIAACALIDPIEVDPPQVPNLEQVATQLRDFLRDLLDRIVPSSPSASRSTRSRAVNMEDDTQRLEDILSQIMDDGVDDTEQAASRLRSPAPKTAVRMLSESLIGNLKDSAERGLINADNRHEELEGLCAVALLSALQRTRPQESPSALAALKKAKESGLQVDAGIIGAGLCGSCNPEKGNYQKFYDAVAAGSWQMRVPKAGHMEFLTASDLFVSLLNILCKGGNDGKAVVDDTKTLVLSWLQAQLRPAQFDRDREAFNAWLESRKAARAIDFVAKEM